MASSVARLSHSGEPALLPDVGVSREMMERLQGYLALLTTWLSRLNLVARSDTASLWQRHVLDCLQLLPLLPKTGEMVDFGSGAGFPGLVLAVASGRPFHLVEADKRKASFLREAARAASASVVIHACRIDQACLPPADLITARALAPLSQLLAWAHPVLSPQGQCVFLKGRTVESELTQTVAEWHMRLVRWQSRTDPSGRILQISELARHARADS